jgi:hypothetical protein
MVLNRRDRQPMRENLFGFEPITSISFSNDEIIENIMLLYEIDRFDLDCTYSIGNFWKSLPQPKNKTDLLPQRADVIPASSEKLPFESESMTSIMFDPPFVIAGETYHDSKEGSSIIAKRFEGFKDFATLKNMYYGTLKETYRLLKNDGILVFKCQDVVSSGKNHFSHCLIMNMALQVGFHPRDLFILMAKNRINAFNGEKWKNQYHARKHHSYFWVLQKAKCRVDYTI